MQHRRTILFLIPHLGGGGAERVAANVAAGLNPAHYAVHIGLVTQQSSEGGELPAWVAIHRLGARRIRLGAWAVLRLVWKLRPDVVLAGMAHLNKLVLWMRPLFPRNTRVLVRQNGQLATDDGAGSWRLYRRADAIICQTAAMAAEVAAAAGAARNLHVLPNPVDIDGIRTKATEPVRHWSSPGPHILAVGRLAEEKGFDLLLRAFVEVRREFPLADLAILGEGRERPALEMLAWVLGLGSTVRMPGHVEHPAEWYAGASVFVLSSRHEGLPNALLEAAAGGLPIVATPASTGLAQLVRGQPGVWVCGQVSAEAIGGALIDALRSCSQQARYAHAWVNAFRMENALAQYEALIEDQPAGIEP